MSSNIAPNDLLSLSSHVARIPKSSIQVMNQFLFFNKNRNKYLIKNPGNIGPLILMTGIIDETIGSFDKQTQEIILEYWSGDDVKTFKELSIKYHCREYYIHRAINKCSILKAFKYIIPMEDMFLEILTKTLKPLTIKELDIDKIKSLKYPPNLYFGILAYIYDHVPFFGHLHSRQYLFSTYKVINNPKRKIAADNYEELMENIRLPFGKVTVDYLFNLLIVNTTYEKLVLLYTIIISNKYEFIHFNSADALIRKGSLSNITLDILVTSDVPLESNKITEIINNYYQKPITDNALIAVSKLSKHIVPFEGNRYGLKRHWQPMKPRRGPLQA